MSATLRRLGVMLCAAAFAWLLADSLFALPAPAIDLRPLVSANLAQSGVAHPVTAVLLNFRGFDTLLEIAVMLVALLGVLATLQADRSPAVDHIVGLLARRGGKLYPAADQVAYKLKWRPHLIQPDYLAFQGRPSVGALARLLRLTRVI